MLFDHRTSTCRPGTLQKPLALYGEHGFCVQVRHLGAPLFRGMTETGNVNTFVHIWTFDDAADRAARRAAMQADPEWSACLVKSTEAGRLVSQVKTLLTPTPFFDTGHVLRPG